jgi:DNA-binding beta-propeller fold protein YncE
MRTRMQLTSLIVALLALTTIRAQVKDPIPAPITNRGLSVEIRDVARLPDSRMLHPASEDVAPEAWARVSFVRDLPDGRRFANDSRGRLYLLDKNNAPSVYADVAAVFPLGFYQSLESGFIGFEFHPEFAKNGLFYTVHGEKGMGNPATPNFIPPGFSKSDVTFHSVITEWHATNPGASTFAGTRRELLRVGHVVQFFRHPFGHLEFNPTSRPGDADYGLLYTSGSDLGFSNGGGPNENKPNQTQRLDTLVGAMLRIDPRSPSVSHGMKGVGDYTIPAINKYAADGDAKTFGEIFAHGFRNTHRFSWDLTDKTLYASDIGMSNIEEINIVREGGNYGWMRREGFFDNGTNINGTYDDVFPLPAEILNGTKKDGFTYPVAIYDHGEGVAISAGFAYHGRIAALRDTFVFGDVNRGRLFASDLAAMKAADDGRPQTVAPVEEIQLYVREANGAKRNVTLKDLVEKTQAASVMRVDLHLSRTRDGEIVVTSRQDGTIRMLVASTTEAAQTQARSLPTFEVDRAWPKVPAKWLLGDASSFAIDARDNVWLLHRPRTLRKPGEAERAAPPVVVFDSAGSFVKAWGGAGAGYEWPEREHGIHIDPKGNVWITGNNCPTNGIAGLKPVADDQILKFNTDGKFLLQIGKSNQSGGNADTKNVHRAADVWVHPATNEAFVADGYGNHRVIVLNADTGAFKRMWGAFGNKPVDDDHCEVVTPTSFPAGPGPQNFSIVHALRVAKDGTVYVADRENRRVQSFNANGKFLKQIVKTDTPFARDLALSPDPAQQYLYVGNGEDIVIVDRKTMEIAGSITVPGMIGGGHHIAADSKGNIYIAATGMGLQKLAIRRGGS